MAAALAQQMPGPAAWRRQHGDKIAYDRFCDALKSERSAHRSDRAAGVQRRGGRGLPYPCRYGSHYLIESAPRHWHWGRPTGKQVHLTHRV
jgi:hypothetical protein